MPKRTSSPPPAAAKGDKNGAEKAADRWRETVFLPRTDFPMRGGLPEKEPKILAFWNEIDLFRLQREQSRGRPKYILHDGPPYANGELHIGTALNKILKDIINRSRQSLGADANYVPGWDCHGLPIEWKVEEEIRAAGRSKEDIPPVEFRRLCRAFAEKWIHIQREGFRRYGVIGDWDDPYLTMTGAAEGQIVRELGKFIRDGGLYRAARPVLWSVPEATALADAEVEYREHVSPSVWVGYRAMSGALAEAAAEVVIWTTTPWTIPGSSAVAFLADAEYVLINDGGRHFVVAASCAESFIAARVKKGDNKGAGNGDNKGAEKSGGGDGLGDNKGAENFGGVKGLSDGDGDNNGGAVNGHNDGGKKGGGGDGRNDSDSDNGGGENIKIVRQVKSAELAGSVLAHPLRRHGYTRDIPLLAADFVTLDQGSGFVHVAPAHGPDDHALCLRHNIKGRDWLDAQSIFHKDAPLFGGARVLNADGSDGDANARVAAALAGENALLAGGRLRHSYPHSWRSRAPLIFRTTSQWFISMSRNGLRETALEGVARTRFFPSESRERLSAMVSERPDWCISRQRLWGVPLPLFTHRESGEILRDPVVTERIAVAFADANSDLWFTEPPERWLAPEYDPAEWEQQSDIVEVWFDSGATHGFVLEARPELKWPADLYLEGTDQHRGWFQSSLLVSCGTRGRPPYDAILTHGFVLDDEGMKMSKSLGNATDPKDVIKNDGADLLRLWVVTADTSRDLRIGPAILKQVRENYRRLRNSLRYLLGGLDGFTDDEILPVNEMPLLERWLLHRLAETDDALRAAVAEYDYHRVFVLLHHLANSDLSSFYFDVRKDSLYCDSADSVRRRAVRTVFDLSFDFLCGWLAPILAFTAEEAWQSRGKSPRSVHLRVLEPPPLEWRDGERAAACERLRVLRGHITNALERAREGGVLNSSLAARVVLGGVSLTDDEREVLTELAIVADVECEGAADSDGDGDGAEVVVRIEPAEGLRCGRCWRVRPEVGEGEDALCSRCASVVAVN
ncbi:MAG: isoleucine--tRNA ligase [Alphaproteobacteria bacterium]|nr:isoleucine--tRNA ligase [Alphaproteobacteria bacterium]MDA8004236.1 isoleucine--tRNA ligase [Alphaproteobacteria bacterium]MDA8006221.1 isoleucine--tRNA ligase [Alphaproteobacteria bacterium]MDA8013438.1 isoleucine--tRNA ligase [Alphaproteobacteria bacterium]